MPDEARTERMKALLRQMHAERMNGLDASTAQNAQMMSPEETDYLYAPPQAADRSIPAPEPVPAPAPVEAPKPKLAPRPAVATVGAPRMREKTLEEKVAELQSQVDAMSAPTPAAVKPEEQRAPYLMPSY